MEEKVLNLIHVKLPLVRRTYRSCVIKAYCRKFKAHCKWRTSQGNVTVWIMLCFISQQLYPTALFFADKLTSLSAATTSDHILYAKVRKPLLYYLHYIRTVFPCCRWSSSVPGCLRIPQLTKCRPHRHLNKEHEDRASHRKWYGVSRSCQACCWLFIFTRPA